MPLPGFKECLHVALFTAFFIVLNAAFFGVEWDLMEVPKNTAFNARNGFRTHSVRFHNTKQ